jgi:hypothetical protein
VVADARRRPDERDRVLPGSASGQPYGVPLHIDFADQCGGDRGQLWQYNGRTGQLVNAGTSICAGLSGPVSAGTEIERLTCRDSPPLEHRLQRRDRGARNRQRPGRRHLQRVGDRGQRCLGPDGLRRHRPPDGAAGSHPDRPARHGRRSRLGLRSAHGDLHRTLPSGASGRIEVAGRVPGDVRLAASYPVSARVSVGGTSQQPGIVRITASLRVAVHATPPAAVGADQRGSQSIVSSPLIAVVAGILVLGTALLVAAARRKQHPAKRRGRHVASKALPPPTPSPSAVPLRRKRREPVR